MSRKASGYHWSLGSKFAYQGKRPASQCYHRDAGLPVSAKVAGFKVRGNKAKLLLTPGPSPVTYQHVPRSLRLPLETGFDFTDSHVPIFLKEGGIGTESVRVLISWGLAPSEK